MGGDVGFARTDDGHNAQQGGTFARADFVLGTICHASICSAPRYTADLTI